MILTVVGARPQFVKAAVVSRAIAEDGRIHEDLIHTGQHFDSAMSEVFFEELGLRAPDEHLGIHGGTHAEMTARMLAALEDTFRRRGPDAVLVYGDTNSTLAAALAAAKLDIPVAHVEAGLRSGRRTQAEEINRVVTDRLSDLLFVPTTAALHNLRSEGRDEGVHHVGDVMLDAVRLFAPLASGSDVLERLGVRPGNYALATVHRAENVDDPLRLSAVLDHLRVHDPPVVLPLHPRTARTVDSAALSLDGIRAIEPLGYLDMMRLVAEAAVVLTDSGGLQKEAYFHRVPCVTLRDETEWMETVEHGWNRLWTQAEYLPRRDIDDYGSGDAGRRIARRLADAVERGSWPLRSRVEAHHAR